MAKFGMVDITKTCEVVPPDFAALPNRGLATTFTFTGPSSGTNLAASTPFSVTLPANTFLPVSLTVTPSDNAGGGSFSPTSVKLVDSVRFVTFTYTPGSTGAKTLSLTNDGGLTNPASLTYTSV